MAKNPKPRRRDVGSNPSPAGKSDDAGGLGAETEEDNVGGRPGSEHDSRGSRGVSGRSGGSGSFERESDDYARNMGNEDRGKSSGSNSERDDDFTELGRQSRFGDQGDRGGEKATTPRRNPRDRS